MATVITEIGALVAIMKGLVDITKTSGDLLDKLSSKKREDTTKTVVQLQGRVAGLAAQLYQTVVLLKTIPAWLRQADDILHSPGQLTAVSMHELDTRLHKLVSDSRYDYFSDAFFRQKFDALPGIKEPMEEFRKLLDRLDEQRAHVVTDGSLQKHRDGWKLVLNRLRDLWAQAEAIRYKANELHGQLIGELEQAATAQPAPK